MDKGEVEEKDYLFWWQFGLGVVSIYAQKQPKFTHQKISDLAIMGKNVKAPCPRKSEDNQTKQYFLCPFLSDLVCFCSYDTKNQATGGMWKQRQVQIMMVSHQILDQLSLAMGKWQQIPFVPVSIGQHVVTVLAQLTAFLFFPFSFPPFVLWVMKKYDFKLKRPLNSLSYKQLVFLQTAFSTPEPDY